MKHFKITSKMKGIYKYLHSVLLLLLISFSVLLKAQNGAYEILSEEYNHNNELFAFKPHPSWNKTKDESLNMILQNIYKLNKSFKIRLISEQKTEEGFIVKKYIQQESGSDVMFGELILRKNSSGEILDILGTLRNITPNSQPIFKVEEAINYGLNVLQKDTSDLINLKQIINNPLLIYTPKSGNVSNEYVLCYKLELSFKDSKRKFVFVNAVTGEIVWILEGQHEVIITGTSLYSGTVEVNGRHIGSKYYLWDTIRNMRTYDWFNTTNFATMEMVSKNNATFNETWQKDAIDVHYGIGVAYDYYKSTYGRNSWDNAGGSIINNVSYDVDYNNAYWNGTGFYYGVGDGTDFTNWVGVDIVGHEFTHAVVEKTAALVYAGESGAINESLADIFGTTIQASIGINNWKVGENNYKQRTPRNMDNPSLRNHPSAYGDPNWSSTTGCAPTDDNDDCGVHSNSGVGNYWFFLLTDGKTGTNTVGKEFEVNGIGRAKAALITYKALTQYLSSGSDYKAFRKATLIAAEDKYGKKSNEYKQVCNAWYAVNVGEKCCGDSVELEFQVKDTKCYDSKDGEIKLTVKKSNGPFEYKWYKGDTTTAVISTSKDISGLDTGRYYVKVKDKVAKCEVVDKTHVKSPDKVVVAVIGGGASFFRLCDAAPKVNLYAGAGGGTEPYTFNWPNGKLTVSASGRYTAVATDKNGCKGNESAVVSLIPVLCSKDPNDIVGPKNYGPKKFVSKFATQQYKIRFENDPDFATAPASRVTVDLPLDNNMDMNTFKVSSFGFNNWTFNVPDNLTTYYKRLDLIDTLGIYLDVTAGLDQSANKVFWIFESIDPSTGLPPNIGTLGFLPVNDSILHNGEGFVDFTIRAKTSTVTGDSLRAQAAIVFDDNSAISTPRIHNIIDAKAPVSKMDTMPAIMDSTNFVLKFKAKDDTGGSGYSNTDLMVSENNGAYVAYQKNILDTFVSFSGNNGSNYRFYTQASDNVDNKEEAKVNPEVNLTITPKNFLLPIDSTLVLCTADSMEIKWKKVPITSFDLQYAADSAPFITFATGQSGSDTIYKWKLPSVSNNPVRIKIRAIASSTSLLLDETNSFKLNPAPAIKLGNDTFYCDGSAISLVLDAGAGFSSYLWSNSSTSRTITVSNQGTYGVTVSNGYSCVAYDEVKVTKSLRPVISSKMINNISCFGNTNGAINIVTVSGTAPYKFLWNTSDTLEDLTGLSAGTYFLNIIDAKGCFINDTSNITEPTKLLISKAYSNVKCKNGSDGSINLTVTGGTGAYSYLWSNSATSEDLSNLTVGSYKVLVKDANNCEARDSFIINEPALLTSSRITSNVKCKNGNDGSIDLSVNGGTVTYSYLWSNSATTQDISALTAGTYSVMITDANACIRTDTVTITEPTLLAKSKTSVNVKCKNGNDGSIDLTVTGGVTPYTYLWSNAATSQDLNNITAGTYNVVITDANGCIIRDTSIITEPTLLTKSKTSLNVKCKNGNDGSIDLTVNGGTIPYTYLWSNNATTQDIATLTAGTYSVRVTDANSCIVRDTTIISEPTLLVSTKTSLNVKCKNGNDGSIDLTVNGGVTPYAYLWSNSATTQDLSTLTAGTYTVRITDANACVRRDTVIITEPTLLTKSKTSLNVKCKNGNDGSIDLTVNGGTTPYTYLWSNSATTQDISTLIAGTYIAVITDANGCIVRDTTIITEPTLLTKSKTFVNVKCKNGNDGSIDLTVNGGTTPYTYLWSNSSTTQDISTLTAGTYSVRVTDANNCIVRDTTVITEPTLLVSSKTSVNVKCKNGNDGSIDLTVTGGVTPYTYLWSNSATTQDLSTLTAGTYTVRITDANSCIRRDTVIITEPALLSSSKTKSDVKCKNGNDGSIDLTVTGGTTPYTYLWSNSATTQDLNTLVAGTYSVIITDANTCIRRDTVIITEPALLTKSKTSVNVKCKNGNDGSIDLTVNGGTTPYTYLWSNSATTQDIATLIAGTYNVRVTDAKGCIVRDTTIITEPTLLVSSKTSVNVKCKNGNDGSIDLTVSGGVTPYTYLWNNSATTQDLSTLTAGTYTVRITDANACIRRDTVIITEPALLATTKSIVNVKCKNGNNGSIDITVTGGTTPYTYLWSNSATTQDLTSLTAGTYSVRITDANACIRRDTFTVTEPALLTKSKTFVNVKCKNGNDGSIDLTVNGGTTPYSYLWSNSATSQDITTLIAGTYSVLVTDANACTVRDTTTITEPTLLTSSKTFVNVKCKNGNNGSIDLTVSGGVTPYAYLWSNSATTQDLSTLTAGTYTVRITDANACIRRDTVIITEPTLLSSSKTKSDVKCKNGNDGSIDLTVTGGTTPYTYLWSNSATSQDLNTLVAGTYSVIITDANACIRRDTVIITEPALLTKSKTFQSVKCKNGNDGSIDLTVNGGTLPYTYLWSNSATTQDISILTAGTYSVQVADANACIVRDTTIITEPTLLISSKTSQNVKCKNGSDGSIDLTVNGGITPYNYLWNNAATTQDLIGLKVGTYSVRITDANACIRRDTVIITEPTLLTSSKTVNDVLCYGGTDGSIVTAGIGGAAPYTYSWNTGESTAGISNKTKGTYFILTTDKNLCFRKDTITINQPAAPLSITNSISDVNCFAGTDGKIDLTTAGGTIPYNYLWSNSKTTEDITGEATGTYSVILTDKNSCILKDTFVIAQPAAPLSHTKFVLAVKCFGGNDGAVDMTLIGGTVPYTYLWSNSATSEDITGLIKGKYSIKVTDKNNCILTDSVLVTQPLAPLNSSLTESKVNCFGGNDGSIVSVITGGTVPYLYKWSNGAVTKDLNNIPQGKYNLVITDSNSCVLKDSITITQPTAPLSAILTVDDVDCYGDNTGAISLAGSGGTPAYTFNWSNGSKNQNITGLVKGKYFVTVSDKNNCTYKDSAFVPEPAELKIKAFSTSATNSDNNGTAWATINGGTLPYTISWNDIRSQSTDTATGLSIGEYIVTVTDAKGCSKNDTIDLPKAPDPSTIGLYPNPNRGMVTIFNLASLGLDETILIDVIDMTGKVCITYEVLGKDVFEFEMQESFRNSTYLIKIHNPRGIQNRKLILIR